MPQATHTFRIFVSSTFSDLKAERNALHKYVFPRPFDWAQGRSAGAVCAAWWLPVPGHRPALACARRSGARSADDADLSGRRCPTATTPGKSPRCLSAPSKSHRGLRRVHGS